MATELADARERLRDEKGARRDTLLFNAPRFYPKRIEGGHVRIPTMAF
jgi:hypothetical protein